jgi:transposase InsO family protein
MDVSDGNFRLVFALWTVVEHYNNCRPHAALKNRTPAEVYIGKEKIMICMK